jgi:hypothetical protein
MLDFLKFNALTSNFNLVVSPPNEDKIALFIELDQVSGKICREVAFNVISL